MKDNGFMQELNKLIAAEVAKKKLDELRPGDQTVRGMMEEHGLSIAQARSLLDKLTSQGYFTKVRIPNPNGGAARLAYRPTQKE